MPKNALADALEKVANRTPQFGRTQTAPLTLEREGKSDRSISVKTQRSKSRMDKKVISGFFDPQVSKQLARLAIDRDQTNQELLREALNDLFTKYQLPPIA